MVAQARIRLQERLHPAGLLEQQARQRLGHGGVILEHRRGVVRNGVVLRIARNLPELRHHLGELLVLLAGDLRELDVRVGQNLRELVHVLRPGAQRL